MNFEINKDSIFEIDSVLKGEDLSQYELEIEKIIDNLWTDIGEFESILAPFFVVMLRSVFLSSLYINYLSILKLQSKYETITVKTSTSVIDIISKKLNLSLDPNRDSFDLEFDLRDDNFLDLNQQNSTFVKSVLKKVKKNYYLNLSKLKTINVLYLNAGKLQKDLSYIPNSLDASFINNTSHNKELPDINIIKNKLKKNINDMSLSIPPELVLDLLEQKVFKFLPSIFNQIYSFEEFINKYKVKLVISSDTTHEAFLCLMAAAKLAKIDSLVIPHGFVTFSNQKLDKYCTYQGTLNDFEPKYNGMNEIHLKASWFEQKI
jgi:hypothetical protein